MSKEITIKDVLDGNTAFYHAPDYTQTLLNEMKSSKPLVQSTYVYNTESKVWRVAKDIFSVIIFPIGLYRLIHTLIGRIVLQSSQRKDADQLRTAFNVNGVWKVKRVAVEVDGYIVDGAIMGQASTLGNGKWVLASNGNGELYEDKLDNHEFKQILTQLNGNALIFNYPGVGASSGSPNRGAMKKAYQAMLNFLEDQEKGLAAREIIGYGHSIGGGVQGDGLYSHQLKERIKYVFVKSRTFSDLMTIAADLTSWFRGFLLMVFGWNISSIESSKRLKAPEIIMQSANVATYTDIADHPELIKNDWIITANASLAKTLLADPDCPKHNKYFMGVPEMHNDPLQDLPHLTDKIEEMLSA